MLFRDQATSNMRLKIADIPPKINQKMDSLSSEDMYQIYSPSYKNHPQSQGGRREKVASGKNKLTKYIDITSEVRSLAGYSPMANDEEFTTAFLHELVHKINPLPVVDSKAMIRK